MTDGPRLLSHDTVYLIAETPGGVLRRAAVVADAVLAADSRIVLDHVLVRSDSEYGFDAMLNFYVPGAADERYLTSERLDEIAQVALDKLAASEAPCRHRWSDWVEIPANIGVRGHWRACTAKCDAAEVRSGG